MQRLRVLMLLLLMLLMLMLLPRSECVQCFARFDLALGQCDEELGEVDEEDCCQNPQYGYQATDGVCRSCGPPQWSPWSPWSQCNVLCGGGVSQRNRKCFGIGVSECENPKDSMETRPCRGSCCEDKGWGLWLTWSPCSVTCGGGGVRRRERVCSSDPECRSACSGPSEETDACVTNTTCPVHGGWSSWSGWSQCSGSCISDVIVPKRERGRSCSSPAPSIHTEPHGNGCPGDEIQTQNCSELPTCPVDGSWGAWSSLGPCSASCGEGLQLSIRPCDGPAPKHGGRFCDGPSTRSSICQRACPVDGFWSGWSSWGECSTSCIPEGRASIRSRRRSCSSPAPSIEPPGSDCHGDDSETENCNHLPHCPVDGGWGSWSPLSTCPVTCGVGLQESLRRCDSPAPKAGGRPCPGEGRTTTICQTKSHCPVHGQWSDWSSWGGCKYPFGVRDIRCQRLGGFQGRERRCLHRAHNGSVCSGTALVESRVCYDVNQCYVKGSWDGWGTWSLCSPSCGEKSISKRHRLCKPDYTNYSPFIGRRKDSATFFGKPLSDCGSTPDGGPTFQTESCLNAPPCT
ncbi:properdin-like [Clinocottus analis]|uniref:properdin-like n=1 Tax=Clinocottus analis TaxID=304258 RepID=UPI0035BEC4B3